MTLSTIKITTDQKHRLEELKVHERQALHEIIELLLDTYDTYVRLLSNDMNDWK